MVENLQSPNNSNNSNDNMLKGMTVERTTNFSEATKEEENEDDVRLTDEELFDLVWKLQKNETTAEKYLIEEKKTGQQDGSSNVTQVKMEENMKLLESVKQYCGIPILMQDADMALIGAPEDKTEILKFENVRMAPSHIQLSFMVECMQNKLRKQKLKEATVVK